MQNVREMRGSRQGSEWIWVCVDEKSDPAVSGLMLSGNEAEAPISYQEKSGGR